MMRSATKTGVDQQPLESLLMNRWGLKYSEARKLVTEAREKLGMPKSGPWTHALDVKCAEMKGMPIPEQNGAAKNEAAAPMHEIDTAPLINPWKFSVKLRKTSFIEPEIGSKKVAVRPIPFWVKNAAKISSVQTKAKAPTVIYSSFPTPFDADRAVATKAVPEAANIKSVEVADTVTTEAAEVAATMTTEAAKEAADVAATTEPAAVAATTESAVVVATTESALVVATTESVAVAATTESVAAVAATTESVVVVATTKSAAVAAATTATADVAATTESAEVVATTEAADVAVTTVTADAAATTKAADAAATTKAAEVAAIKEAVGGAATTEVFIGAATKENVQETAAIEVVDEATATKAVEEASTIDTAEKTSAIDEEATTGAVAEAATIGTVEETAAVEAAELPLADEIEEQFFNTLSETELKDASIDDEICVANDNAVAAGNFSPSHREAVQNTFKPIHRDTQISHTELSNAAFGTFTPAQSAERPEADEEAASPWRAAFFFDSTAELDPEEDFEPPVREATSSSDDETANNELYECSSAESVKMTIVFSDEDLALASASTEETKNIGEKPTTWDSPVPSIPLVEESNTDEIFFQDSKHRQEAARLMYPSPELRSAILAVPKPTIAVEASSQSGFIARKTTTLSSVDNEAVELVLCPTTASEFSDTEFLRRCNFLRVASVEAETTDDDDFRFQELDTKNKRNSFDCARDEVETTSATSDIPRITSVAQADRDAGITVVTSKLEDLMDSSAFGNMHSINTSTDDDEEKLFLNALGESDFMSSDQSFSDTEDEAVATLLTDESLPDEAQCTLIGDFFNTISESVGARTSHMLIIEDTKPAEIESLDSNLDSWISRSTDEMDEQLFTSSNDASTSRKPTSCIETGEPHMEQGKIRVIEDDCDDDGATSDKSHGSGIEASLSMKVPETQILGAISSEPPLPFDTKENRDSLVDEVRAESSRGVKTNNINGDTRSFEDETAKYVSYLDNEISETPGNGEEDEPRDEDGLRSTSEDRDEQLRQGASAEDFYPDVKSLVASDADVVGNIALKVGKVSTQRKTQRPTETYKSIWEIEPDLLTVEDKTMEKAISVASESPAISFNSSEEQSVDGDNQ